MGTVESVCERGAGGGGGGVGVKDGGERRPLCLYPLTLGWAADGCWEGFAPVEVGGQRDWALAWGATEPVSVAVWSRLIKAGAAAGSVALSRGIGLGEKKKKNHRATVPWVGFLSDWVTEAFAAAE